VIKSPNNLTFGFFYDGGLNHQAFIKRSLFSDYFFYNENYKICADWEFFIILISIYNVSHKYLNEIICYYDFSGISAKSENLPVYNQEREKTLNKYFSAFKEDAKLTQEMRQKE
jgi:hypothetical protein